VSRNYHARLRLASFTAGLAALAVLSCRSGESTGPLKLADLPADSQPRLAVLLPPAGAMTAGTMEHVTLTASNVRPQSCSITGPGWLGLSAGADPNVAWTVAPTASGTATLVTACVDARNAQVLRRDTLLVYEMPTVTPDISGVLPVSVGDSVEVSYDSTFTSKIDVACSHCDSLATMKRVGPNTLRLLANAVPVDATPRGVSQNPRIAGKPSFSFPTCRDTESYKIPPLSLGHAI
jgi:hypothetical protein